MQSSAGSEVLSDTHPLSEGERESSSETTPEYVELEHVLGSGVRDKVSQDDLVCTDVEAIETDSRVPQNTVDWTLGGKLYGRTEESLQLLDAFERQLSNEVCAEFVLLSGPSGTGKTALARTLREKVVDRGGFFISGKFDQLHCTQPYAGFVAAFTEFTSLVVCQEMAESVRRDVDDAMDSEVPLITDVIPALQQILTSEKDSSGVKGSEAQKRLHAVFCKFVQSICSLVRPLVLCLENLQWADEGSLDLLRTLVSDKGNRGLMVVGTCRNNEVTYDHPLAVVLREMEDDESNKVSITNIEVSELSRDVVHDLVLDLLCIKKSERSKSLANIVHAHTGGNVFFALHFLKSLHEEGLLSMNESTQLWQWDENRIDALVTGNDVVHLVASKMTRLPSDVQDVLKVASCIGTEFDEYLLNDVLPPSQVSMALEAATDKGFLLGEAGNGGTGGLRFAHNNVQQAAYSLIPENERDAFHLSIGRKLWEELSNEDIEMNIFVVGNQLKRGVDLLQDDDERCRMAVLFLRAAEKATESSDFITATGYLGLGIELLGRKPRHWRDQYDLSLALYNASAEAEYCTGNFERMDFLIDEILQNARTFRDKIRAYTTKVYALGTREKLQEAIDTGVGVLEGLGESIPSNPNTMSVAKELILMKYILRGKSDTDLLNLPVMTNTETIASMQILNLLFTYSFLGRSTLLPSLTFRMIRLTLRQGLSAISSVGFASCGMVLCVTGDVDSGYRYGQLALTLLKRFNSKEWLPRVYCLVYGVINVWKNPLCSSIKPLKQSHQVGLQTGDVEYAMVGAHQCCTTMYYAGRPLGELQTELRAVCEQMSAYKQRAWLSMANPVLQHILNFMGLSEDPLVLTGEALDQEAAIAQARENEHGAVLCTIHIWRLILAFYFNEYRLAWEMSLCARGARKSEKVTRAAFMVRLHYFYHGLTALALARETRKRGLTAIASRMLKRIRKYAKHSPSSFLNKVKLMEAELSAIRGDFDNASRKYEESIAKAKEEGLLHEQALACECAGLAMRCFGHEVLATTFLRRAQGLYHTWSAHAKVEQIKNLIVKSR